MWRVLKESIPRCAPGHGLDPQVFVSDHKLWMTRCFYNLDYASKEDSLLFEAANLGMLVNSTVGIGACVQTAEDFIEDYLDDR